MKVHILIASFSLCTLMIQHRIFASVVTRINISNGEVFNSYWSGFLGKTSTVVTPVRIEDLSELPDNLKAAVGDIEGEHFWYYVDEVNLTITDVNLFDGATFVEFSMKYFANQACVTVDGEDITPFPCSSTTGILQDYTKLFESDTGFDQFTIPIDSWFGPTGNKFFFLAEMSITYDGTNVLTTPVEMTSSPKPPTPLPTQAPPGDECDPLHCEIDGDCRDYTFCLRIIDDDSERGPGSERGRLISATCGPDKYFDPIKSANHQVVVCSFWEDLNKATQDRYREDLRCSTHCELIPGGLCSADYIERWNNGTETKESCDSPLILDTTVRRCLSPCEANIFENGTITRCRDLIPELTC